MMQQLYSFEEISEGKKIMASNFKIYVSGIGMKIKNGEEVKQHLACKADIEEEELTVVEFKPRSDSKKGVCVLEANEGVIDKIHISTIGKL